ncbi:MAG TPA: hypothetical protein VKH43_09945 [Thermoanaerobaculia bacterium]|nr:hypothetical protein [Thermoanaerobaculia bacterium]
MSRIAVVLFLVFAALFLLRILRVVVESFLAGRRGPRSSTGQIEGEMVKDPVCGTWIDRRLALAARSAGEWVPVCSEKCRERLQGT